MRYVVRRRPMAFACLIASALRLSVRVLAFVSTTVGPSSVQHLLSAWVLNRSTPSNLGSTPVQHQSRPCRLVCCGNWHAIVNVIVLYNSALDGRTSSRSEK